MEQIVVRPRKIEFHGNIIGNELGYIESLNPFESQYCKISKIEPEEGELLKGGYGIYGITLEKCTDCINYFSKNMQYCTNDNSINVFICDQLEIGDELGEFVYTPIVGVTDIFDMVKYDKGYVFTVKEEYIDSESGINPDSPYFLLLHDNNMGVAIPEGVKRPTNVCYSCEFSTSFIDNNVFANFVFLDSEGHVISLSEPISLMNSLEGESYRLKITEQIPNSAAFVSVEFRLPEGLEPIDEIRISKNCLLFDVDYNLFVRSVLDEEENDNNEEGIGGD